MDMSVKSYLVMMYFIALTMYLCLVGPPVNAESEPPQPTAPTVLESDNLPSKIVRTLLGHKRNVTSVAFSPDGKILASGSEDESLKLWNIDTGEEIRTLKAHNFWVTSVAFSPDGKLLASGGEDKIVNLWEVSSGKKLDSLHGHDNSVTALAFSGLGELGQKN
jgi:WD40 repeat protein